MNPRDDIALMDGYHSPQLDVKVRLNTNESPYPPPPAWLDTPAAPLGWLAANPSFLGIKPMRLQYCRGGKVRGSLATMSK